MKLAILLLAVIVAVAGMYVVSTRTQAHWPGVDETVVEKAATAAGRPPRPPLFDPGAGDLRAFLFLIAGAAGGFVGGYYFRELLSRKGTPGGSR
jgi:ABC-type cobalt transport system substrate-binding protein